MANLKEIRSRIISVNSTMQITSAMKMVSAAKLRRAQDAVTQLRPYATKLQDILSNLSSSLDANENEYAQEREIKNVLVVAITSNRGLCGAFNNNVIKAAKVLCNSTYKDGNVKVLPIGKKAFEAFKNTTHTTKGSLLPQNLEKLYEDLTFEKVAPIAENIMDRYKEGSFDKVILVYNKFKNAATQELMREQFLPILPSAQEDDTASVDYLFEPSKEQIIKELIPKSLKTQLFKAVLDSHASEHGARMTAMHKATDNANDLQKALKLHYNKARQAAITAEILEIVGGAEALKG